MAVTGRVEPFAEIRPERVRLTGNAGEPLAVEVEIFPRKDHPFNIKRVEAQNGTFIKCEIKERCTGNGGRCLLRVENTKVEKGNYVDRIVIHTDHPLRPMIPIYVSGAIR